jgi:RimJ/RimL family protein N-acetyltransferase
LSRDARARSTDRPEGNDPSLERDPPHHRLRPLRLDDLPDIATWLESPQDLGAFASRIHLPVSAAALEVAWSPVIEGRDPRAGWFFGVDDPDGRLVAFAGIEDVDVVHRNALCGVYIVARPARGAGLALPVRALLLDLAFGQLGMHRVTSMHLADNVASRRRDEACGLRYEGLMREAWFTAGKRVDVEVFGILADEWWEHRPVLAARLPPEPSVWAGDDARSAWPPQD